MKKDNSRKKYIIPITNDRDVAWLATKIMWGMFKVQPYSISKYKLILTADYVTQEERVHKFIKVFLNSIFSFEYGTFKNEDIKIIYNSRTNTKIEVIIPGAYRYQRNEMTEFLSKKIVFFCQTLKYRVDYIPHFNDNFILFEEVSVKRTFYTGYRTILCYNTSVNEMLNNYLQSCNCITLRS